MPKYRIPGPGKYVCAGVLRYRDTTVGLPVRAIRRARFEVWLKGRSAPEFVGETDERGAFDVFIAADSAGPANYDVTILSSGPAGDVDMRPGHWFWLPLNMIQSAEGGDTLTFNRTITAPAQVKHFNALDAIYAGWKYARTMLGLSESGAARRLKRVRVIPTLSEEAWTLEMGAATHIWIGQARRIFRDNAVLHEYGHHLQRMNGSWAPWPSTHNGCQASLVGTCPRPSFPPCGAVDTRPDGICWINSPAFAWFEGFPTYFARAVLKWDAKFDKSLGATLFSLFGPGCPCVLLTSPHTNRAGTLITGSFIEDHVTGGLLALASQRNVVTSARRPIAPPEVERLIFRTWFLDMNNQMGTTVRFRALFGPKLMSLAPMNQAFSPFGI